MTASTMQVLDGNGDTTFSWSADSPEEVKAAKAQFNLLKKSGYLAYTVKANGAQGDVIAAFDPAAEKIIMAPPLAGG